MEATPPRLLRGSLIRLSCGAVLLLRSRNGPTARHGSRRRDCRRRHGHGINRHPPVRAPAHPVRRARSDSSCFYAVVVLLVCIGGGNVPDRMGPARTGWTATVLICLGVTGSAATAAVWGICVSLVPLGIGIALQCPGLPALTLNRVSDDERPRAPSRSRRSSTSRPDPAGSSSEASPPLSAATGPLSRRLPCALW